MLNYALEYYKKYKKVPIWVINFADNFRSPNQSVVNILKKKAKEMKITSDWDKMDAEAHSKAFTVAKVMSADVLQEIYDYCLKAQKEGQTLKQFQKGIEEGGLLKRMQEAGWTGKTPSRLKVIYDTNKQVAFAKGKYEQQVNNADEYPFWKYVQIQKKTKRHDHSQFHNKVFRFDDPIWKKIYPPSGFGCKCSVIAIKDGSEVEDGAKYLKELDEKSLQLQPIGDNFQPDFNKYPAQIAKDLKKAIVMKLADTKTKGSSPQDIYKIDKFEAKSIKEAEQFCVDMDFAKTVHFLNFKLEYVNEVISVFTEFKKEYQIEMFGNIYDKYDTYLLAVRAPHGFPVKRWDFVYNFALIGTKDLANPNWMEEEKNLGERVGDSITDFTWHEIGHLLTAPKASDEHDELAKVIKPPLPSLSRYYNTNALEALAEIFCFYKKYGKSKLKKVHIDFFNKYSPQVKL